MAWKPVLTGGLIVAAVVSLGVAVTGGSMAATTSTAVSATPSAVPSTSVKPSVTASPAVTSTTAPTVRGTVGPVARPTSVQIPAIGVSGNLIPLGIQGQNGVPVTSKAGEVEVPSVSTPQQIGYYSLGYLPGQIGSAVLIAHVDGDGMLGAFHDIGALKAGDKITVDRSDGTSVTFTVTSAETILKKDFNDKDVFGSKPDAELTLVSCGGRFNESTHQYDANVVVKSTLLS